MNPHRINLSEMLDRVDAKIELERIEKNKARRKYWKTLLPRLWAMFRGVHKI